MNEKEVNLKKVEIEIDLYKELLKIVFFLLSADVGGTITLILNSSKYPVELIFTIIPLGVFVAFGLIYVVIVILFELKTLKKKLTEDF